MDRILIDGPTATDVNIFVNGGETMKVDDVFKVDCIERETKASAFNIRRIFRTKEWKEEELPRCQKR